MLLRLLSRLVSIAVCVKQISAMPLNYSSYSSIHPTLWPFQGIKWEWKYYFYTRLVFSSRSSPKIFDLLSRAICWIAKNKFHIDNILHLLDDFLTIDPPEFMAERSMALLLMLFKTLNIPIAAHKTEGPTTCLEYLGIILDSELSEARLPTNKVDRINRILKSFLGCVLAVPRTRSGHAI